MHTTGDVTPAAQYDPAGHNTDEPDVEPAAQK
jgi:hypothetical protein